MDLAEQKEKILLFMDEHACGGYRQLKIKNIKK